MSNRPYESNPANPILTNCNQKGQLKQIQGTGHGDFVQAEDGSWWVVFLAYCNMGGSYHHMGRETCLAPVEWPKGGWPVINGGETIDTLMTARLLPQKPYVRKADELWKSNPAWIHIQNPDSTKYEWIERCDRHTGPMLRLYGSESSLTATTAQRSSGAGRRPNG